MTHTTSTSAPAASSSSEGLDAQTIALVERARDGDLNAFRSIVEAYQRPLYYAVMRRINHPQDAADVVQQTFVKVFEKLSTLREPAAFRGWLYQIAFNNMRNQIRQNQRQPKTSLEDAPTLAFDAQSERTLLAREQLEQLKSALHLLSPKQREVLLLRLDSDMSYRDIAAAIESSEGAVRVHFHNAIRRLKEALARHDESTPQR